MSLSARAPWRRVLAILTAWAVGTVPPYVLGLDADPGRGGWRVEAYLDASYSLNFNFPENHRWRSRTTTPRSNELSPNMGLLTLRKTVSPVSRWGVQIGAQGGYDTRDFAFGQDRPRLAGADTLRHVAYANVSYLAPVGRGLLVTAGLFDSLIGYESLYANRNPNYSRSWIADNSPYKMLGLYAQSAMGRDFDLGLGVVNGYWYLADPNSLPSYVVHAAWRPTSEFVVVENVYYGPDQQDTALQYWRLFSNFILQWRRDALTVAVSYDLGTERLQTLPGAPRTYWTGAALFARLEIVGPWSLAFRPEVYYDQDGRQTGFEQLVKAVTTTLEYRMPVRAKVLVRLEHRWDESTGAEGGFFRGAERAAPRLTESQHLLFVALLWSFESPAP